MKRREALRHIGLSAGYIAATPALFSLLQSCESKYTIDWTPEFLSMEEAKVTDQLVNLIIPETDTPGARALNIPVFIDKYFSTVISEEEGQFFKYGMGVLIEEVGVSETNPADKISEKEYDAFLAKHLKISKEKQIEYGEQMGEVASPEDLAAVPREVIVFNMLSAIRGLSVYAYKNTEYVGENVLAYLPVPGSQVGCDSLETLTGGKAWSL